MPRWADLFCAKGFRIVAAALAPLGGNLTDRGRDGVCVPERCVLEETEVSLCFWGSGMESSVGAG